MTKVLGPFLYVLVPSAFGDLSIVWWETEAGAKVYRVFLPKERIPAHEVVQMAFPGASSLSCSVIAELQERMQCFLEGTSVDFGVSYLDFLALERCSEFQRRVLLAEHKIPRGWVSTYGGLARQVGIPGGARAIGGALSNNPFPIIIPCHRAIMSDGALGGYQGGVEMKRALLEMEGIEFTEAGKVITDRLYY
jgi:methylated-DNA-[protein]-cysteine S-methyltransferase